MLNQEQLEFYKEWTKEVEEKINQLRNDTSEFRNKRMKLMWKSDIYEKDSKLGEYFKDDLEELKTLNTVSDDELQKEIGIYSVLLKRLKMIIQVN